MKKLGSFFRTAYDIIVVIVFVVYLFGCWIIDSIRGKKSDWRFFED